MRAWPLLALTLFFTLGCDDDSPGGRNNSGNNTTTVGENNGTTTNNSNNTNTTGLNNGNTQNNTNGVVFVTTLEVGPGQTYETPCEVPWHTLTPSTLVRIHHRSAPYACKFALATAGTADAPLVVRGIPSSSGALPVITGENAVTNQDLDYWNEDRSVVKVGGVSHSSDFPSHITIENLEIRSGRPEYTFTDDSGNPGTYRSNAASIHVEEGDHITVRGCTLTDSGNGFFAGHGGSNLLLQGNYIYGNGIEGSYYEHNNYTEVMNITFEYNHFGPLREGCGGNNLKDRSAGTVVRYNFVEGGNRALDLVDSDHEDIIASPAYRSAFVYGNILIKYDDGGNNQMVHYGGDSGETSRFRKGTLWFYNNTVYSQRESTFTLFRLSTNEETAHCFNNIVFVAGEGNRLAIIAGRGVVELTHNWLMTGWVQSHDTVEGTIVASDNVEGDQPGVTDASAGDFTLTPESGALDQAMPLPAGAAAHPVSHQYVPHQGITPRPQNGTLDLGAFER